MELGALLNASPAPAGSADSTFDRSLLTEVPGGLHSPAAFSSLPHLQPRHSGLLTFCRKATDRKRSFLHMKICLRMFFQMSKGEQYFSNVNRQAITVHPWRLVQGINHRKRGFGQPNQRTFCPCESNAQTGQVSGRNGLNVTSTPQGRRKASYWGL